MNNYYFAATKVKYTFSDEEEKSDSDKGVAGAKRNNVSDDSDIEESSQPIASNPL